MRTPKKVWKDIAGKLKNKKGTSATKGATVEKLETYGVPEDAEEVKGIAYVKEQTNVTETGIQSFEDINKNSEDLQPVCESKKEAQNASVDTTVREPNTPEIQPPDDSCFDSDAAEEKPSKRSFQPIVAGVVGAILLASSVALYVMKMPVVAVVGGIIGLACIGFALYNTLNPNTKLEKVEQPLVSFESNSMLKSSR